MAFGVNRFFRRRYAPAWLTLVVGLAATAMLGWQLHREAVALDRQRLAMRVAEVTAQLDARLEKSEMLLQQLRDYLMLSGETRPRVFARWCYENRLSINCPWLHGIAVATNRNVAPWRSQLPKAPDADWKTLGELALKQPIECDIALRSEVVDMKRFMEDYDLKRMLRIGICFLDAPRFNEVFWGETKEKRAFEDRHENTKAYIDYMRPRCVQLARVLKKTGSFYYHCDWHASHYAKAMLGQIFWNN